MTISECVDPAELCILAIKTGHKILICGNGGSAAMASHFAAELVVRYAQNRRALPCIALTADQAVLTAAGNDIGFQNVFSRQVEALGQPGDILIALSTSGKSENVLAAIAQASAGGLFVIEAPRRDFTSVSMCQERQLRWIHNLAAEIEQAFV